MNNMNTTPIFVIGSIRSGTTFLGNILASSNLIAAVQYEVEYGVHESSYFNHVYGRYGDIKYWPHYVEFIEATFNSDYFQLTGVSRDELYQLYPTTYSSVFRFLMDRLAIKEGATHWIEKSPNHALELDLISKCYPDALFIAIKRDLKSVVKSALGLTFIYEPGREKKERFRLKILQGIIKNYYRTYKSIESFSKSNRSKIITINYEDLVSDQKQTLATVKRFINFKNDLEYTNQYKKNTSFKDGKPTSSFFTKEELSKLKQYNQIYKRMPLFFFVWKDRLKKYILSKTSFFNANKLPSWFYRSYEFKKPNQ